MKMKKRIWSLLLCAALLLTLAAVLPGKAQAETTLTKDSDGYYLIGNEDDLFAFAALVNGGEYGANGKLTANITMTGSARPWTPIGALSDYTGTFDGQGHTISKLYYNDENAKCAGLFGYVKGGTIRNVTVADSTFSGMRCGAIVGSASNANIEGCGNLNTTVTGIDAGGIAGIAIGRNIRACWNTGTVNASSWAGGICGYLGGTVKGCWNTGNVDGEKSGGIVGVTNYVPTIAYCYNDGMVVAEQWENAGAIVGIDNGSGLPNMSNCYYTRTSGGASFAYGDDLEGDYTNVARVKSSMLPTGEGALFLNQGLAGTGYQYYQNLDNGKTVDAYPVPSSSHGTVYRGYKACSNTVSYSNSPLAASMYHQGVDYKLEGLTFKEVCTNTACTVAQGLGSVTLKVTDVYYTGSPMGAAVEGSLKNGATYKVTYDGSEEAPSQVGRYTATLTVYEDSTQIANLIAEYTISYLPAPALSDFTVEGHSYVADGAYWFADTEAVVIPPEGYTISKTLGEGYAQQVSLRGEDAKTVYLKRTSDGALTDAIDLSDIMKFDSTAPKGDITLSSGNFWTMLNQKAPFNVFFKEAMTVEIKASDDQSGVKSVQYYVAEEDLIGDMALDSASAAAKLETAVGDGWQDYNGEIALDLNGKYVVYAKVTDNVGNVSYVSTTGIVLYTDAVLGKDGLIFTYGKGMDAEFPVTFNGNTVKEIRGDAIGVLDQENDYIVDADGITLKTGLLNKMKAGTNVLEVICNPLGEEYADSGINQKPGVLTITLIVEKANYDMSKVKWDYTEPFQYDGKVHRVELTGLPDGVTAVYSGSSATAVGDYTAVATLVYDEENYNPISVPKLGWTIGNEWMPTEYTVTESNDYGWLKEDFVITPDEGYQISLTNTAEGEWEDKLTCSAETGNGSVTFYLKDEKGLISQGKTETYKIDKTAPTGGITIGERSWTGFFVSVYDKIANQDLAMTVNAADTLSGVEEVAYIESETALTAEELAAKTGWKQGDMEQIKAEDGKKVIYYARVTDKVGNVAYLASNGTSFDTLAPGIAGVEEGKTYYVSTAVTVKDKNLESVKLNGEEVGASFTVPGDAAVEYTIVATDKAGNETVMTFVTGKLEDAEDSLEGLTPENVTLEDESDIDELLEVLKEQDLTNATEEEKAAVEELIQQAEKLQEQLEKLMEAANTEAIDKAVDILEKDNGKIRDIETVKQAIADIDKLLEDFDSNLTEDEERIIEETRAEIVKLLEKLEKKAAAATPNTGDLLLPMAGAVCLIAILGMAATLVGFKRRRR